MPGAAYDKTNVVHMHTCTCTCTCTHAALSMAKSSESGNVGKIKKGGNDNKK
jgi:hypothetical protein